ncbi:MAG: alanine racemase [Clostridia bacterium]|nr:alanine racemase [Clostridia bacterium]
MTCYKIKIQDVVYNWQTLATHTGALTVPMLKANAYGLGAQRVLSALEDAGADTFALSRIEEAEALQTDSTLWVLTCYHGEKELRRMIEKKWHFAVDSLEQAECADRIAGQLGLTAHLHIAIDTGFGRFGFLPHQTEDMLAVFSLKNVKVEALFSHLGAAFFYNDPFADEQLDKFSLAVEVLRSAGAQIPLCHIANSSAALRDKKFHLGAVRIGSALCGRLPVSTRLPLKRVGNFVTEIVDIRTLPKGQNIGYGKVYNLTRDTKVAVLAVGTADGIQLAKDYDAFRFRDFCRYGLRIFKMMLRKDNRMRVSVNGKSVPVIGRVAMTHMMIDVTDIEAHIGDEVIVPISPLYVADHVERCYE